MLIEESPRVLMEQYNSPFLEDIVTKLFKAANEDDKEDHIELYSSLTRPSNVEGTHFRKFDPELYDINAHCNNKSSVSSSKEESYKIVTSQKFQNSEKSNVVKLQSSKCSKIKALVVRNSLTYVRNSV